MSPRSLVPRRMVLRRSVVLGSVVLRSVVLGGVVPGSVVPGGSVVLAGRVATRAVLARGRLGRVLRGSGPGMHGSVRWLLGRGCHMIGRGDGRTAASGYTGGDRRDDDAGHGGDSERQPGVPASGLTKAADLAGSGHDGRGDGASGTGSQIRRAAQMPVN